MNADSTTTAVLTAVRHAVDEATPAGSADAGLPQVLAAARARRRRRRVTAYGGAAGAGLAVSAALTLALAAPGTGLRATPGGTAAQAGTTGAANPAGAAGTNVSLAAWSVQADGGGSVTVTLRELADAAQLKQALAAKGVPALLHFGGGSCSADGAPQRGPGRARPRRCGRGAPDVHGDVQGVPVAGRVGAVHREQPARAAAGSHPAGALPGLRVVSGP